MYVRFQQTFNNFELIYINQVGTEAVTFFVHYFIFFAYYYSCLFYFVYRRDK